MIGVFFQAPEAFQGLVDLSQEPGRVKGIVELCQELSLLGS